MQHLYIDTRGRFYYLDKVVIKTRHTLKGNLFYSDCLFR